MKKTITLLFAIFLALGISAQNFGVGLDFMMLSGTMIEDAEGNAVTTLDADGETVEASSSSAVLNVSYTHPLADKLDMVGSVGYGMMFGLVPMKLGVSYGIASNISANLGMGMYAIKDKSYRPAGEEGEGYDPANKKEFGINLGVKYQMDAIGIGLGYDMIKGGDDITTLNAFTIGLSYSFGASSADDEGGE
jgi:putative Mn2+ efflux pump MntP